MRLERLTRGHVVAAVAALVLLLVMAMDWYGSTQADQARQISAAANPNGAESGEVGRNIRADAATIIARDEKNAWQETATIDRVLLVLLLVTVALPPVGLGSAAAFQKEADYAEMRRAATRPREPEPEPEPPADADES